MSPALPSRLFEDLRAALALLTRLPVPGGPPPWPGRGVCAAWAYPLAGVAVAGVQTLVLAAALALGLGPGLAAGLALVALVMATGALHEDGLADCADGFWGGATPERRLEIMKDSRIGAYGVLALILGMGLRWLALAAIASAPAPAWPALVAVAALARAGMVAVWAALPAARPGGLSAAVGRPRPGHAVAAIGVACLVAFPAMGVPLLLGAASAALVLTWLARLAQRRIGGQTGDVLGAAQQLSELTLLLAFAAAP